MEKLVVKGGSDYSYWLYELIKERGIIAEFERCNSGNKIVFDDLIIDLDVLYMTDYFPRLMSIYHEMGEKYKEAEGVVLGLSYARDSIDCKLLSKKFVMFANSAQDIYYDNCCLAHHYDRMSNLKYVIHNYSPFSLRYDESMSSKKDGNVLFYYSMYGDKHNCTFLDDRIKQYSVEKNNFNIKFEGVLDWWEIRKRLWSVFFERSGWRDPSSEDEYFDPEHISEADINTTLAQYNKPYPKTIEENKRIITDLYTKLVKDDVRILIYFQPMNEYYRMYWNEEYYHEVLEFANDMKKRFGCKILDMTLDTVPVRYYRDLGHMNLPGKEYMSGIIDNAMSELYY